MESLGTKLKTRREEKGLTLDFLSQETNIAKRYLEALEREDFTIFPGEPYLLGFLKNYGAYLELDGNELLSLYRSLRIQEQPDPVDELLKSPSNLPKIIGLVIAALVVLGLIGWGIWFFFIRINRSSGEVIPARTSQEYTMSAGTLEHRFYPEDVVVVPLAGGSYKLELSELGDTVTLAVPGGPVRLDLGQKAVVDLDGDGFSELSVTAADFVKTDSTVGARLIFELASPQIESLPQTVAAETVTPGSREMEVIFKDSPSAYPFTLQAAFQGYCLFRWEILFEPARQGRNERYFQHFDELDIQAQNGIRIGLSNAQAVKLQAIGGGNTVPLLEVGAAGEVVAADLRWIKGADNRYRLVLTHLD